MTMFKLTKTRCVLWPVSVNVPLDGGAVEKHEIKVSFELLPTSESDALLQGADTNKALLRRVIIGWEGIADEDGAEIVFSAEALEQAIDVAYVRVALLNAYFQASSGTVAQEKN